MTEYYIKRSEVEKAICTVQTYRESILLKALDLDADGVLRRISQLINNIPSADVVEVVRCKDCKNYDNQFSVDNCGWCDEFNCGTSDERFCSYGERKEGDDK